MTNESRPVQRIDENSAPSPEWNEFSAMVDNLDETVEPLLTDPVGIMSMSAQQDRIERLVECKSLAIELQKHLDDSHMPLLPDKVANILKRIQETLNRKLH